MYQETIKNTSWTPRQMSEDMTIPQLIGIWGNQDSAYWQEIPETDLDGTMRAVIARKKAKQEQRQKLQELNDGDAR